MSKTHEASEILSEFAKLLAGPTNDGQEKRRHGKPLWKVDSSHLDAMHRHLHRYDMGERVDEHSGSHPLVHVAWRALAVAWQETHAV